MYLNFLIQDCYNTIYVHFTNEFFSKHSSIDDIEQVYKILPKKKVQRKVAVLTEKIDSNKTNSQHPQWQKKGKVKTCHEIWWWVFWLLKL